MSFLGGVPVAPISDALHKKRTVTRRLMWGKITAPDKEDLKKQKNMQTQKHSIF